ARRPRRDRRGAPIAGQPAHAAQPARRRERHRPRRSGGEPVRRHEVARRLRDAGRHDPACRASGDRKPGARPRCRSPPGRGYAELIYNGFWFSPEREMLQALIDKSQEPVTGTVRLKLYKGAAHVVGRKSPNSLYSLAHVTFEEDQVYDQRDAEGFIKLNALRLRLLKSARR